MTPLAGIALASSRLSMPRVLKLPATCNCSSLSQTSAHPSPKAAPGSFHSGVRRRKAGMFLEAPRRSLDFGAHQILSPLGSGNFTVSWMPFILRTDTAPMRFEAVDHCLDQHFGRRGARCHAHARAAFEPLGAQFVGAVHHVAVDAELARQFGQPVAVGTGGAAHDDHHVDLGRHELHGVLAVLRGVADVLLLRFADCREALAHGSRDRRRVIHRQRGLRHDRELLGLAPAAPAPRRPHPRPGECRDRAAPSCPRPRGGPCGRS